MEKEEFIAWLKKNKIIIIIVAAILVVIFLSLFGTTIFLYLKLALGNDVVVKLEADQTDFILKHNQEETVRVEAKVTTNPFCTAVCNYKFIDLSKNLVIDEKNVTLASINPLSLDYPLKADKWGSGLDLYRFDLDCHSTATFFCHTTEEPATRSVLLTIKYHPDEEEEQQQQQLQQQLKNYTEKAGKILGKLEILTTAEEELTNKTGLSYDSAELRQKINDLQNELIDLNESWKEQDLPFLEEEINKISWEQIEPALNDYEQNLSTTINLYNKQLANFLEVRGKLMILQESSFPSVEQANQIVQLIEEFNQAASLFNQNFSVESLDNNISLNLIKKAEFYLLKRVGLEQGLILSLNKDVFCLLGGECLTHLTMQELSELEQINLNQSCQETNQFYDQVVLLNQSLAMNFSNQSYPLQNPFWEEVGNKVLELKNSTFYSYLDNLPENGTNSVLIQEIMLNENFSYNNLSYNNLSSVNNSLNYDLFPALVKVFLEQLPPKCQLTPVTLIPLITFNQTMIELDLDSLTDLKLNFNFELPSLKCCVFGECRDCCVASECEDNPLLYPILFLHGHAISQGTSAEYSLEGFNDIQNRLEEEGFLNAGTVTLYTSTDSPEGVWGLPPVPLTIRGSYYFDVFKQPDNYYLVQTKSENIDTYAIRLKELVDIVKYKTGKPKVNIVAFSMGGLVARRYLQIFGTENAHKLVMIGTPNKGITGTVAEICAFAGAELECRDLQADSLFMNKLNSGKNPDIPVYNIVGTGCEMDG
ncbi:MAG: alpha/beta hydrolase, partial [Nanoarchaeota archaeon]|nr:alpha/beta hydrolase [Nanoarchaeota archaeon]MBU1643931.1 alpha/beta hydrolase [Nanoarchaeota archaeon]